MDDEHYLEKMYVINKHINIYILHFLAIPIVLIMYLVIIVYLNNPSLSCRSFSVFDPQSHFGRIYHLYVIID